MRILLIGKGGQVGFELRRTLAVLGEVFPVDYPECDLADPASVRRAFDAARPDVVVNAAAYTAVARAESEPEKARAVNAVAPGLVGEAAREAGATVVHFSTDYVFDGKKGGAYVEEDPTCPVSVYGATKRDGEEALAASGARHLTFRTSWVFGAVGHNFVRTILRLAAERESLDVVADQVGAPTTAALLADVTAHVLAQLARRGEAEVQSGVYHLVASGETSWHGFARAIVRGARERGRDLKLSPEAIRPIPTSAYPVPAKRPANSRLDTSRLRRTFGLVLPSWEHGLDHVLTQIL